MKSRAKVDTDSRSEINVNLEPQSEGGDQVTHATTRYIYAIMWICRSLQWRRSLSGRQKFIRWAQYSTKHTRIHTQNTLRLFTPPPQKKSFGYLSAQKMH